MAAGRTPEPSSARTAASVRPTAPTADVPTSTTGNDNAVMKSSCSASSVSGDSGPPNVSTNSGRDEAGAAERSSATPGIGRPARRAASAGATGSANRASGSNTTASGTSRRTFAVSDSPVSTGFQ